MPSLRSQTRARATTTRSRSLARRSTGIKLVPADPEEYESSVRNFISDDADYARPEGLEEPWPYVFQRGDSVWIKLCGKWFPGTIWGSKVLKGLTHNRETEAFYFCVYFWGKARKFVSPLNGDVKPDTDHIRQLLEDAGNLPSS